MKTGILHIYNDATDATLSVSEERKMYLFDGAFEAIEFATKNGINIKGYMLH